jgi:hypothetical protein
MQEKSLEELCVNILELKDKYISYRLNQIILDAKPNKNTIFDYSNYSQKSNECVTDVMFEFIKLRNKMMLIDHEFYQNSIDILLNTEYRDFKDEYITDKVIEHFGAKDTIAFASVYNDLAEDFNALSREFVLTDVKL